MSEWNSCHWVTENQLPDGGVSCGTGFTIAWQRGSLAEQGRNGAFLTEVLEACLDELKHKDRLFPCGENKVAIAHLKDCLSALNARIQRRRDQGIFGTHEVDKS
jgi:hypothetical protein